MSIRQRIEKLEQIVGTDYEGAAETSLTWAPHEDPPEFLPADVSPATVEMLNMVAAMDDSVPRCD